MSLDRDSDSVAPVIRFSTYRWTSLRVLVHKRGAEVAALFYTLFESAKLAGVDPHAYVLKATRRAIASPGTLTLPEDLT